MLRVISLALLIVLVLGSSGCATMFNNGSQSAQLRPTSGTDIGVSHIKVEVTSGNGTYETTIPGTVVLEPSASQATIRVTEACFEPTEYKIPRSITASYWANIPGILIYVGLFGFFVDPADGTMWKYDTNVLVPVKKVQDFSQCRAKLSS